MLHKIQGKAVLNVLYLYFQSLLLLDKVLLLREFDPSSASFKLQKTEDAAERLTLDTNLFISLNLQICSAYYMYFIFLPDLQSFSQRMKFFLCVLANV